MNTFHFIIISQIFSKVNKNKNYLEYQNKFLDFCVKICDNIIHEKIIIWGQSILAYNIRKFDFIILDAIQGHLRSPFMDELMPKITILGDKGLFFIFVSIFMLFFKQYRNCGISCLTGMMCGVIVGNLIVKNIVRRSRPCWINDKIDMLIEVPKDYSFPSGHTLAAFIFATVVLHYDTRIGIPALIIAAAIAFSRMYLYVHFPTDILFGVVLGILIGCSVVHFLDKYLFT